MKINYFGFILLSQFFSLSLLIADQVHEPVRAPRYDIAKDIVEESAEQQDSNALNWLKGLKFYEGGKSFYVMNVHADRVNNDSSQKRFGKLTSKDVSKVKVLDLSFLVIRDGYENLKRFTALEELNVNWASVGGEKLMANIADLQFLKTLRMNKVLSGNRVVSRDKGLSRNNELFKKILKNGPLEELEAFESLTEQQLIFYKPELAKIKRLSIGGQRARLTNEGLTCLANLGPSIKLNLNGNNMTLKGYSKFLKSANLEYLEMTSATDEHLLPLKRVKTLRSLILHESNLTSKGMGSIRNLPLERLLIGGQLDDKGFSVVKSLEGLTSLSLHRLQITDKGIKCISGLKQLKRLTVNVKDVTVKGLSVLKNLKELEFLRLNGVIGYTKKSSRKSKGATSVGKKFFSSEEIGLLVSKVVKSVSSLKHLDLGSIKINDSSMKELKGLKALEYLSVQSDFTDIGLKHVSELTNLKIMHLSGVHNQWVQRSSMFGGSKYTDKGIAYLARLDKLVGLDLRSSGVTEKGLKSLLGMKGLRSLILCNCSKITDDAVPVLRKFHRLRFLDVRRTKINKNLKDALSAALKKSDCVVR